MTWTRRVFVRGALKGWLGLVATPVAYFLLRSKLSGVSEGVDRSSNLGKVDDFKPGSSRLVYVGRAKIILARTVEGQFHAVSAVCTHLGCSIRFKSVTGAEAFVCNCHASTFNLSGLNVSGPAPAPLRLFGVSVVDGELIVSAKRDATGV